MHAHDGIDGTPGGSPPDAPGCPDDNLLAGYADGRLTGERRVRVEEHLVRCAPCRDLVLAAVESVREEVGAAGEEEPVAVGDAGESVGVRAGAASGAGASGPTSIPSGVPSLADARERRRRSLAAWAVAAGMLLAVGLGFVAMRRGEGPATPTTPEGRLVAAAARLVRAAPDDLAGFRPADAAERRTEGADVHRSGLEIEMPAETLLTPTPTFRWSATAASPFTVVVADGDGQEVWRRTSDLATMPYPMDAQPLAAGAYVLEVSARGPLGETTATRAFRVASEAERAAWERVVKAAETAVPDAVERDVVLAHAAARRSLWLEAEVRAGRAAASPAADEVARDTWAWVRRRLGRPADAPR